MGSIEQRGATRFRLLGFATIPCEITHGAKTWNGIVTNASETGLGLEINALGSELSRESSVNISLDLLGESWSLGGRLTHMDPHDKHRRLKLGVQLTGNHAANTLQQLCQGLARSGRASGLDLRHHADQGSVMTIHGALSLKTISDAINLVSTSSIERIDFSACRNDGKLGGQLGLVALQHRVKMSGCCAELAKTMAAAKVCPSCRGC